jgi:hypothetical protein
MPLPPIIATMERPGPPQRQNLRFAKAFFEVFDLDRTVELLGGAGAQEVGDATPEADRWFYWQEPAPRTGPSATFLIRLRGGRMVLEGPSAEAVGRGWRALEASLEPAALPRVAAGDDLGRFLPRRRKHSADRPESWNREHERKVLDEFYSSFCDRWTRLPQARLDGRSPREAAADPALRAQLDRLLATMERVEEERRARGLPSFSVEDLRAALAEYEPWH